jgi:alpha-glucosidase (family GH31 glycosyl hydrolase)
MFETQQLTPMIRRIRVARPDSNGERLPDPALGDEGRAQLVAAPVVRHDDLAAACADLPIEIAELGYDGSGAVRVRVPLAEGERLYGACDADAGGLQRRGERVQLVNEIHPRGEHLLASDQPVAHGEYSSAALAVGGFSNYAELLAPFVVSSNGWAIYVSSAWHDAVLDMGATDPSALAYDAPGGEADIYVIGPGSVLELVRAYIRMTGRQPLPPAWTLGFLQSRFSYQSFDAVHEVLERFVEEELPVHGVIFDVHWLRDHIDLQWEPTNFPDPAANLARIAQHGVRSVVITEPGTKTDASNYASGAERGVWATDADGAEFDSNQWYAHRGIDDYRPLTDTNGALLNVFREDAADWWYEQHLHLLDEGVDAWWLDLNEPEDVTPDVCFPNVDWPAKRELLDGREVRSLFAIAQQRLFTRRDRKHTSRRPFLLSRGGSSGSQRYGVSPWSGDVGATWDDLRVQTQVMLNAGLCGFAMMGSDIGGFSGDPGTELFARWMQLGAVSPVMRAHGHMADREPWSQGPEATDAVRASLLLRAQLLPSLLTWVWTAFDCAEPYVRPMLLGPLDVGQTDHAAIAADVAGDARWQDEHDQWFFGPLLVAPVLEQGATSRRVELPAGTWVDIWTGARHEGGGHVDVPVELGTLPIFASLGTVLIADPSPLDQRGRNWPPSELEAWTWATGEERASTLLRVDDGITRLHEQGAYCLQRVDLCGTDGAAAEVQRLGGAWPASRVHRAEPHPGSAK